MRSPHHPQTNRSRWSFLKSHVSAHTEKGLKFYVFSSGMNSRGSYHGNLRGCQAFWKKKKTNNAVRLSKEESDFFKPLNPSQQSKVERRWREITIQAFRESCPWPTASCPVYDYLTMTFTVETLDVPPSSYRT